MNTPSLRIRHTELRCCQPRRAQWLRLGVFLLVVSWCVTAFANEKRFGITSPMDPGALNATRINQLGVGSIRFTAYWDDVEPNPNDYRWVDLDRWVNAATANDMDILITIHRAPGWAAACAQCMPYNISDWYDLVAEMTYHYRGYPNIVFGVWNEPNLWSFFHGSPDDYATLFQYASMARNAWSPSARLAGPETSHISSGLSYFAHTVQKIIPYMNSSDVFTIHWYPGGDVGNYMAAARAAAPWRDVWLSEVGHGTSNDNDQWGWISHVMQRANQALGTTWTKTIFYQLYDPNPSSETFLKPDGSPRLAFQNMADTLNPGWNWNVSQASFQASNGQYVVGEDNGNSIVNANRNSVGAWETFVVVDLNFGSLQDGDEVLIYTGNGYLFSADGGGGGTLNTYTTNPGDWERFTVLRLSGPGTIQSGDQVALRTVNGHYVVAEGGGGDIVNANRTQIGPWETFTIIR